MVLSSPGYVELSTQVSPDDTNYTENVFVDQPTPQVTLCTSCTQSDQTPAPVDLGYQAAGTAIVLGMYIPNTGYTFYSNGSYGSSPGPGITVTQQSTTEWTVTFEDGGTQDVDSLDADADITVTVSESSSPPSTPPASSQYGTINPGSKTRYACSTDPVNCATGNFTESATDVSVPGRGPNLDLTRTYNSLAASTPSPFGYGWSDSYGMSLSTDPTSGDVTISQENGSTVGFTPNGSGGYSNAIGDQFDSLTKNADGTWTYVRDASSSFTFSSAGQLLNESDPNGYVTSLSYNASGQLASVTDPAGRSLAFAYGSNGDMSAVTDPAGNVTTYAYDANGDLSSATSSTGVTTSYSYSSGHLLTNVTKPDGGVTTNTYNGTGQVTQQVDPLGRVTGFTYGPNWTNIAEPNGSVTDEIFSYDQMVQETQAAGTPLATTTSYEYDPTTLTLYSVTDADGHTTTYGYDANGNVTSTTDALGNVTSATYNGFDEPLTKTTPLGVTTTYTYDANGNVTSESTPINATTNQTTTYSYADPAHPGDVTAVTDPDGHTTTYAYDAYGDLVKSTDPAGDVTTDSYNVLGQKVASTSPDGNTAGANAAAFRTAYTYDQLGRMLTSTDPLGDVTKKSYDRDGNLVAQTAPDGQVTRYAYDADDELVSTTNPDGSVTSNSYDAGGNLVAQKNADGQSTTYGFNLLNQKTSSTDALGHTTTYTYDPAGLLVSGTNPSNVTTSYTYDADGRVVDVTYSDGTHAVQNQYDADGELTYQNDATGGNQLTYDSLGRLTQYDNAQGGSDVSYAYDQANNLTSLTVGTDPTVTYAYNGANEMTSVNDGAGNTTSFAYDPSGNLTTISHPDGSTDAYSLNAANGITQVKASTPSATLYDLTTARNADGDVASQTASVAGSATATTTYGYDANQQLTGTSVGTGVLSTAASGFSYDPAGNLTSLSVAGQGVQSNSYNAADELASSTNPTSQASTTYAYNAQDERTSQTTSIAGQTFTTKYFWNGAGQMTGTSGAALTAAAGALGTNGNGSYSYDGLGLLAVDSIGTLSYDFAGSEPEIVSDGIHEFVRGPGGLVVEELTLGQEPLYYHHDQLGSTKALTDSNGHELVNYSYTAYGLSTASATGVVNPIGFADSYTDPLSGLIYLMNRWYDPSTAQFLSVDPLVEVTTQAYSYTGDDPVNRTDPTGECGCTPNVGQVLAGAVAGAAVGGTAGFGVGGGISAYLYGGSTTAAIINGTIDLAFPEVAFGLSILQIAVIVGLGVGLAGGAFGAAQCSSTQPSPNTGTQDKTGPYRTP